MENLPVNWEILSTRKWGLRFDTRCWWCWKWENWQDGDFLLGLIFDFIVYLMCKGITYDGFFFFLLERDFEVSLLALFWSKRFVIGQYVFFANACLTWFLTWRISTFLKEYVFNTEVHYIPTSFFIDSFFPPSYWLYFIQRDIHSPSSNPLPRLISNKLLRTIGCIWYLYICIISPAYRWREVHGSIWNSHVRIVVNDGYHCQCSHAQTRRIGPFDSRFCG